MPVIQPNADFPYRRLIEEYQKDVIDYAEQYPMTEDIVLECAKKLGIRLPNETTSGQPTAKSLDLVVTSRRPSVALEIRAYDVVAPASCRRGRTAMSLLIASEYCRRVGIAYSLLANKGGD